MIASAAILIARLLSAPQCRPKEKKQMDMKSLIDKMDQLSQLAEAGSADKKEHPDMDQDDKRWDDAEEADKEEVNEGIVIQADGQEAMALLDMLKLAGQPASHPVMSGGCGMTEEDDPTYSNTPDEQIADMDAATPSGNDLHREKEAWRAAAGADNPMVAAMEGKLAKMFESLSKE